MTYLTVFYERDVFLFVCRILCTKVVDATSKQAQSEYKHSLTFPPKIAQAEGTPYHFPKLHPGPCSSAGIRRGTVTQTDTQTRVTNIHFASATPHAKCHEDFLPKQ